MNTYFINIKPQIDSTTLIGFEKVNPESTSMKILLQKEQQTK